MSDISSYFQYSIEEEAEALGTCISCTGVTGYPFVTMTILLTFSVCPPVCCPCIRHALSCMPPFPKLLLTLSSSVTCQHCLSHQPRKPPVIFASSPTVTVFYASALGRACSLLQPLPAEARKPPPHNPFSFPFLMGHSPVSWYTLSENCHCIYLAWFYNCLQQRGNSFGC